LGAFLCDNTGLVPARIPSGQSQGELDSQAESARQMHEFWKKVAFGGYLVSGVLTGGAVLAAPQQDRCLFRRLRLK